MKIGILGAGSVGGTLGKRLAEAGHTIRFGVRDPEAEKHQPLSGERISVVGLREAAEGSEAVILAVPWAAAEATLEALGDLGGKPLIDATNPIGPGFALTHGHTDSGAEQVARWAPSAKVVKCFNSTGYGNMDAPRYGEQRSVMFLAGDDEEALGIGSQIASDVGFEAVAMKGLAQARLLEPLAMLWIRLSIESKDRDFAFAILRR